MISIIIPVYNEESTINDTLSILPNSDNIEIIIVDGGSQDRTIEFAKRHPVKVIQCTKGRAFQMNVGAKQAKGDIFLFLHADCLLEKESLNEIGHALDNGFVGGCLSQRINSNRQLYRFIETSGNIRAKIFKIFYGDQGIFVRKSTFFKLGGFDRVDLFDDVLFSQKLKKAGKICILNKKIYTSARRWEKQGVIKTTLINWLISIGFIFGVSPEKLKKIYYDVR